MKTALRVLLSAGLIAGFAWSAQAQTKLTIATVNNGDMIRMQKLTDDFKAKNPDIELEWVTLEENVLRQKVTTDIATKGGQFDVLTIGTYEVPIWAKKGWLVPLDNLGADYDVDDLLPAIRAGLSRRRQALRRAVLRRELDGHVPQGPVREGRPARCRTSRPGTSSQTPPRKITDKASEIYGICLRGKAGWGENMAFLTAMSNSFGARWFDENWKPQFDQPEWKNTLDFYVDLMKDAGPPGASSNGFNENLALFNSGKCGMWIDATVAASFVTNPKEFEGRRQGRLRARARQRPRQARQLAVGVVARHSRRLAEGRSGREVHRLGDRQGLSRPRRLQGRLGQRAAGHAHLALQQPRISEGGAVRQDDARLDQHGRSDPSDGEAGALCRRAVRRDPRVPGHRRPPSARSSRPRSPARSTVDDALEQAQDAATREMTKAGYIK